MQSIPQWGVLWEVSSTHQRACGETLWGWYLPRYPLRCSHMEVPGFFTGKVTGPSITLEQVALSPGLGSQQEWADSAISPLQAFPGFMVLNCPHSNLLPLSAPQREKWKEFSLSCALVPSDPGSSWTQSSGTAAGGREPVHQTGLSSGQDSQNEPPRFHTLSPETCEYGELSLLKLCHVAPRTSI